MSIRNVEKPKNWRNFTKFERNHRSSRTNKKKGTQLRSNNLVSTLLIMNNLIFWSVCQMFVGVFFLSTECWIFITFYYFAHSNLLMKIRRKSLSDWLLMLVMRLEQALVFKIPHTQGIKGVEFAFLSLSNLTQWLFESSTACYPPCNSLIHHVVFHLRSFRFCLRFAKNYIQF